VRDKYTPGPWAVLCEERRGMGTGVLPGSHTVAVIARVDPKTPSYAFRIGEWVDYENEGDCPNARLVAAAPELAKALDDLLYVMNPDEDGGWFLCEEAADIVGAAREALRKATGG